MRFLADFEKVSYFLLFVLLFFLFVSFQVNFIVSIGDLVFQSKPYLLISTFATVTETFHCV